MSVIINASSVRQETPLTLRQFRLAVVLALLAILAGCFIYLAEKYVFEVDKRFVENPTEITMRAFGVGHFLVGWLFLFTSPRLYRLPALSRLTACTLCGVLLCLVFWHSGAARNPVMLFAFYSLFLIHEVRDQADLFLAYGDGRNADRQVLGLLRLSVCLLLVTVLAGAYLVNGLILDRSQLIDRAPVELLLGGMLVLTLLAGASLIGVLAKGVRTHGSLTVFAETYRPLLAVYGGILGILLLGSLLGSVGFNLIILVHVTCWLVFVRYQLTMRSQRREHHRPSNLFAWLRTNPAGFLTLHLGVVVVTLVLMALRVYVWQRGGVVSVALSSSSFPYWSFMHIAMSFARAAR